LLLDLPADWFDVTDDLPRDAPPTLARNSGVGALQFSIARYHSGKHRAGNVRIAMGVGDPEIAQELAEATRMIGSIDF